MRPQRLVALTEVLRAVHARGHPLGEDVVLGIPVLQPAGEGPLLTVLGELLLQQLHPVPQEPVVVVELAHRPRLAGVRVEPMVGGGLVGGHRHLVAADVVGVRIAAVLVVGGHHVRPERPDQLHQLGDRFLQGHQRETSVGQRRRGVALGQAGVDEPQPVVFDPEDLRGGGHLVATDRGDPPPHVGKVHRRVEDVAPFAAGQGDDEHAVAFVDIARQGRRTLARLVVRVGVHRHQPKFGHDFSYLLSHACRRVPGVLGAYSSSPE